MLKPSYLVVAALVAALPAAPPPALAVDAPSRTPRARHADGTIVKRGDTGGTVARVQRALGVDDDGIFGPRTARAVRSFQARAGLRRTGKVDRRTWRALFREPIGSAGVDAPQSGGASPSDPADPFPPAPGDPAASEACPATLAAPLRGTRTSGFGDGRNHAGIDLAARVGTPVRAAACGVVNVAGSRRGYGTIVCIRHTTAFVTCYAHLGSMAVSKGTVVGQGRRIGSVGMTGRTTGAHLHFETRVAGRARDPEPYLAGSRTIPGAAVR